MTDYLIWAALALAVVLAWGDLRLVWACSRRRRWARIRAAARELRDGR